MTTPTLPISDTPLNFLTSRDLLKTIVNEISLKVVGEESTIKAIFLCSCGRLVKNNQIASFNLLVNDESGTGKDFVTDATLDIWSEKVMLKRTRISPQVFTYWKQQTKAQKEMGLPEWTWDGKILYLEDIANAVLNCDTFKVMCSSGSHATIVKDQQAFDIKINGKPVIIVTSASANPSTENIRRFSIVNLDATESQTEAIMQRQAERAASGARLEYNPDIKAILSYLDRYAVDIPFAEKINKFMPKGLIMRTHFQRFLDFIKASCCLHQYMREVNLDNGHLIAERQDYEVALDVLKKITSNPKMISLTKNQQKLIKIFESLGQGLLSYSVPEVETKATFCSPMQLYRDLDKLADWGFFKKDRENRENSKKPVMVYTYINNARIELPSWEQLGVDKNV